VACLIGAGENPLVVTDHGLVRADRPGSALRGILYRAVLRKSRRIITYTQAFALTNPDLALFPERLCIIPPAINVADFERTPRVGAKAQEIRGKDPSPILLFVGRIVHYKGLDTLLDAFDRLDAPARLLIVGDGPELARLKERTKSLTRGRHVDFVGEVPRDQIAPYYYAAHVLVLPALTAQESFSQAVLEAAICGIPAIGTRVGSGLEELIGDQKGGLVVPPGDSRALAAALGELLRDDETRLRLGSGARRRALERYAPAAVEEMLIHLYAEVAPN
jgi:glycosyltransferase involved in cell wall biosynthesis